MSVVDYDFEKNQRPSRNSSKTNLTAMDRKGDKIWTPDRQRFMMFMYFAGSIIVYSSRTAMALCMPEMYDEFGWDKKQQGLVMACFLWGYPVTQVLGGYLADKFGPEIVILSAGCGWATVTFLTPLFPYLGSGTTQASLALMIFSRMTQGILQGMHYPSVMSATGKHVAETERTFVYSVISSGTHGGTLFTGLVGSIILHQVGWASVFHFLGVLGLIWLFVLHTYGDLKNSATPVVAIKENILGDSVKSKPVSRIPWGKVLRAPPFWAMLVGHFANGYSYFVYLFWLPSFFHENYPKAQPWVYNVLPWLVSMISAVLGGMTANLMLREGYSKTFTRKSLNVLAMLLFGVCLIGVGYTNTFGTTLLLFCVASAGNGYYQSTVIMNPSDITPDHTGFMFGVMNTFGAIPGFIGTYISGAILEATNNWNLMYAVTGWVSVIGWAVFGYWGSGEPII